MSLLNEVLQDLDERAPAEAARPLRLAAAPSPGVAASPKGGWLRPLRLAVWPVLGVAAALAAWWIYPADERLADPQTLVQPLGVPVTQASPPAEVVLSLPAAPAAVAGRPDPVEERAEDAAAKNAAAVPAAGGAAEQRGAAAPDKAEAQETADRSVAGPVAYLPLRNTEVPPPLESPPPRATATAAGAVKSVRRTPPRPLERARQAIATGELAAAESLLHDRLRSAPADRAARELLIGLMLRGERHVEVMQQLETGLDQHPGHLKFVIIKARLLADAGELDGATALLEGTPVGRADRAQILQMLAALYQRQGQAELAVERYRELLALKPAAGEAWAGLAVSLDSQGDTAAAAAYRRALEIGGLPAAATRYARQRLTQLEPGND